MKADKNDYVYETSDVFGNKRTFGCKPPHCLICKHCTDVFIDLDGTPYWTSCDLNEDTDNKEDCKKFELKENAITIGEYIEEEENKK